MDSAMRDLEQIREQGDEGEGRPMALVALLIGVTVALVLAMGSLVGWSDEEAVAEDDPLARIDRAAGGGHGPGGRAAGFGPGGVDAARDGGAGPVQGEIQRPPGRREFVQEQLRLARGLGDEGDEASGRDSTVEFPVEDPDTGL
jgi:hypothetical protein